MKILIISLPRCGSTSLLYKISEKKKLKPIFEPFDVTHTLPRKIFENDIVLKTIVNQLPEIIKNPIEWYVNFSKEFDETILLSRKDLKACAESLAYYNYYKNQGFSMKDMYFWEETPNYEICSQYVNGCNFKINKISELLKKPIIYYEDLFYGFGKERLRKGNKSHPTTLI